MKDHAHHTVSASIHADDRRAGVVVAAFPAAAEAGAAALRGGGNAVDAACAAAWALAVCEPAESGLGGQTTMLIRLASGACVVVDGHSRAPKAVVRSNVKRREQARGIKSMTIPSTPAALGHAQRRYGRLSLRAALEGASRLAREGYVITKLQRRLLRWTKSHWARASGPSESAPEAGLFLKGGRDLFAVGDTFRQPALADTLERLATHGVEDFYTGAMAREIVMDMHARGGLVSSRDLASLGLPVEREPMSIRYRKHAVVSIPPPGGGTQALLALRVLEPLISGGEEEGAWRTNLALATLAAFRERERWPDHPADMTPSLARWMLSPERAERLVELLRSRGPLPPADDSLGEEGNTTHLCAADSEGNIVSLTQSIQSVFGSKVAHPTLGFLYNNYLSTCPRTPHPYRLGPGAMPQSNAAPTLVLNADGSPRLVLGSAGSRRITSSIVQVISAVLDRGRSLVEAVAAPRAHALLSGKLWLESSMDPASSAALAARFTKVRVLGKASYKMGAVHAIEWDRSGAMHGVADPRRDGAAV